MATRKERVQSYRDYVARCKSSGDQFQPFFCPHCRFDLEAKVPDEDDKHDSLATCPTCEGEFFYVSRRGQVQVHVPGKRPMNNQEVMAFLMGEGSIHPLQELMVILALEQYCEKVASQPEGFMQNSGVDEATWRSLVKRVGGFLQQRPMVDDKELDDEE